MRRFLCIAAVLSAASATAYANPIDTFGWGARGNAMAGAQTAATDDGGANYYNPGAIAKGDDIRVDIGYQLAVPTLSINGGSQNVDSGKGLDLGLIVPGNVGGIHVAFGLGVFLPDERLVRLRTLPSSQPRWALFDNRPQRFFLGTNLAIQIGKDFYIGGGVGYMSRTAGDATLTGRVGYPNENDSDLALGIDVSLFAVRYPQAGMLWHAKPWLDVGLTYRGGVVLQVSQGVSIIGDLGPASEPVVKDAFFKLHTVSLDLFQPTQLAAGFSAQFTRRLLIAGDLTWEKWSDFENPAAQIVLDYDLKQFNDLVHIPGALPLEKTYFHDIVIPRIGFEYLLGGHSAEWRLRGGYSYEQSPVPEQRGETNFVDNDKHTFSAGLGLKLGHLGDILPKPFDIDLFFSATILPERADRKLSPVDPIGDYVSSGHILAAGIMTRWRL